MKFHQSVKSVLEVVLSECKKQNGEEYEPESLKGIKNSLDRYLSSQEYGYSLARSDEIKSSREVLVTKGRQLKKKRQREKTKQGPKHF